MTVDREDFEEAVTAYWHAKSTQMAASMIANAVGTGTAGSVRGGKQFNAIARLLAQFFFDAGFPASSIAISGNDIKLPGYYRPSKNWDVVVSYENTLVAAFELKALGGPSYGNNYNNRVEEALGSALDVRRAQIAERFSGEDPWLGFVLLVEDSEKSRSKVRTRKGFFEIEEAWKDKSYQDRCALSCRRMLAEKLYDAALCVSTAGPGSRTKDLDERVDWRHFHAAVEARISYLRELGIPRKSA